MNKNTPEYRRMMNEAVKDYQAEYPDKFAVLMRRAKDDGYDRRVRDEEARRLKEGARLECVERFSKPVLVGLPNIDMSCVRGVVAYRTWSFDGRLKSTAMQYCWKELNFADRIPTEFNNSGFYCIKLSSLGVMTTGSSYFSSYGRRGVSGFVELLGEVVEHTDGVLRAEVAKLICLFVTSDNSNLVWTVKRLHEEYVTPIYVLNPEQLADVVIREVLRRKYYGGE